MTATSAEVAARWKRANQRRSRPLAFGMNTVPKRQRPEVPVAAQQGGEGLVLFRRRHRRTAGVGGVEDEAVHPLGMAGGERGRRRATPRVADQAAPLDAGGLEHGLELVDVIVDRRGEAAAVRQTASEPVVPDEAMRPGELGAGTGGGGVRPQLLDMRQPTRQHHQRPSRARPGRRPPDDRRRSGRTRRGWRSRPPSCQVSTCGPSAHRHAPYHRSVTTPRPGGLRPQSLSATDATRKHVPTLSGAVGRYRRPRRPTVPAR